MSIMFPSFDVSSTVKRTNANIDYLKSKARTIDDNSPERKKGKYTFYEFIVIQNRI